MPVPGRPVAGAAVLVCRIGAGSGGISACAREDILPRDRLTPSLLPPFAPHNLLQRHGAPRCPVPPDLDGHAADVRVRVLEHRQDISLEYRLAIPVRDRSDQSASGRLHQVAVDVRVQLGRDLDVRYGDVEPGPFLDNMLQAPLLAGRVLDDLLRMSVVRVFGPFGGLS